MNGKKVRISLILFLIICIVSLQLALSKSEAFLSFYFHRIFLPFQKFRSALLNKLNFSLGDYLYLFLFLLILLIFIRLVYFAITFKNNKDDFWIEGLRFFTFPLVIYLCFLIFWGGNYNKKPIHEEWKSKEWKWNQEKLIELNDFLILKINETVAENGPFNYEKLKVLNQKSNSYFHQYFDENLPVLKVKVTSLGYFLNYLGIHGYYNPLSGEAQFNKFILPFMHPFVITHEMAHQIGIAREDDANLLAYVLGVKSEDPIYRYSAYFNLFLYANADLKAKNQDLANEFLQKLNPQSMQDIKDLRAMYLRYKSFLRGFSNYLYEEYLILHGQDKGLDSYNQVTEWVYFWEIKGNRELRLKL